MVEYKMNYGPAIGEHSAKKKEFPQMAKKLLKKIRSGKFFKIAFFGGNISR